MRPPLERPPPDELPPLERVDEPPDERADEPPLLRLPPESRTVDREPLSPERLRVPPSRVVVERRGVVVRGSLARGVSERGRIRAPPMRSITRVGTSLFAPVLEPAVERRVDVASSRESSVRTRLRHVSRFGCVTGA